MSRDQKSTGASEVAPATRGPAPVTAREAQLLSATLEILREEGYDRLTVDAVAARARASKSTVYRRWPSKAELVVAAVQEGVRKVAKPPDTGSLRDDLLRLGQVIAEQTALNGSTLAAVLPELRRSRQLRAVVEQEFIHQRKALVYEVLNQAVARNEISRESIVDELWDLLPGYLIFRALMSNRPASSATIQHLVDDVLLPSFMRDA